MNLIATKRLFSLAEIYIEYLKSGIGSFLSQALREVAIRRPRDPSSHWLPLDSATREGVGESQAEEIDQPPEMAGVVSSEAKPEVVSSDTKPVVVSSQIKPEIVWSETQPEFVNFYLCFSFRSSYFHVSVYERNDEKITSGLKQLSGGGTLRARLVRGRPRGRNETLHCCGHRGALERGHRTAPAEFTGRRKPGANGTGGNATGIPSGENSLEIEELHCAVIFCV
ncbi:hypothetical protein TNCT_380941 [Trichonephila clavata]|uniref:Uncharacterized protein n=1 Tax=Trichonephila clavata TaxID=2740835 RepID=A0A8X6I3E9_TRICU|nr:hypothetical protein TNCT_380941 [Trichonephila clavata]